MPHEIVPLAFFAMIATIVVGTPIARAFARRIASTPPPASLPDEAQRRLERMEQAIETIAVEVERIAEGQRFTTRLLAERNAAAGTSPAGAPDERRRASNG